MRPVPCSCWTEPADVTHWLSAQQAQETDPVGGEGWAQTDRHIHTRRRKDRQNTHTQTHTVKPNHTNAHAERSYCKFKENLNANADIHTDTHTYTAPERTWQSVIQITTYDDILLAPQEQSSALMRRLTFSRSGHSEATQIQLIQQINSYYQNLRDFLLLALREVAICFQTTTNKVSHL